MKGIWEKKDWDCERHSILTSAVNWGSNWSLLDVQTGRNNKWMEKDFRGQEWGMSRAGWKWWPSCLTVDSVGCDFHSLLAVCVEAITSVTRSLINGPFSSSLPCEVGPRPSPRLRWFTHRHTRIYTYMHTHMQSTNSDTTRPLRLPHAKQNHIVLLISNTSHQNKGKMMERAQWRFPTVSQSVSQRSWRGLVCET